MSSDFSIYEGALQKWSEYVSETAQEKGYEVTSCERTTISLKECRIEVKFSVFGVLFTIELYTNIFFEKQSMRICLYSGYHVLIDEDMPICFINDCVVKKSIEKMFKKIKEIDTISHNQLQI